MGEALGTFTLVFFGCGIIAIDLLTGAGFQHWEIGLVWGTALAVGISFATGLSGAHLNPAITLALAIWRKQSGFKSTLMYVLSQLAGAVIAATLLYSLLSGAVGEFEAVHGLKRGTPGSELSTMMFGEYYPNPALTGQAKRVLAGTSTGEALLAESIGTAFLAFVVFAVSARRRAPVALAPVAIGTTLAIIISVLAPITQAGLNPARDFGPRLVSYFAGWGATAIPGPGGGFWIYIVGPLLGALLGGGLFELFFKPGDRPGNTN